MSKHKQSYENVTQINYSLEFTKLSFGHNHKIMMSTFGTFGKVLNTWSYGQFSVVTKRILRFNTLTQLLYVW